MSEAGTRGLPVSPVRTRPHILALGPSVSPFPESDPAHHILPDNVPFVDQVVPQMVQNIDQTNTDTNSLFAVAHNINYPGNDETFSPAMEELSNTSSDERVAPSSPIVTPQREDESLVPGTFLTHPGGDQQGDRGGDQQGVSQTQNSSSQEQLL